jgi:maltooligosyltrehalose trehalohydrolase
MDYPLSPVGASFRNDNKVEFTVWAPLKDKMHVVIQNPSTQIVPMDKDDFGYWRATVSDLQPYSRYFFRINEDKELPDPASRYQPDGVHGPSAIVPERFGWTDEGWKGLQMADMVIYELHVGTFTSTSDFDGIIGKLPYLKTLGINTIELMPVAQFPGSRNWGYDGVFPFAVQNSYGGPAGLKKLVNAAHREDIAVLLDVVYNHQGPEGNYLGEFAPYFSDKYKTFWGSAINFDDAFCDGVRNFYLENALMWLDEFHIDGLRLDAVHAIWDFSATHFIEVLSKRVRQLELNTNRHKVLIAEFDLNNPRYIKPASSGGYGMDGQWIDEFHHALHSVVTKETNGYYEDFGTTKHLEKAIKDSYVYTGQYSVHRKKFFGRPADEISYSQFVVFAQNHDQVGNRMLGDRLSTQVDLERLKLAAAAVLLAPQVPMLFMGEEYGETRPFQYFISHTDEKLVEMVREGRRKEFAYFKWEGEVPDPQDEKTFNSCILSFDTEATNDRTALFNFYKYLIKFRRERSAMKSVSRDSVVVHESGHDDVIVVERTGNHDRILIVLNVSDASVKWEAPREGKKIFDSAADEWLGPGEKTPAIITQRSVVTLQPTSVIVLELQTP